jgi:serralysin
MAAPRFGATTVAVTSTASSGWFSADPAASPLSGDASIDGLLGGHHWDERALVYAFPDEASDYAAGTPERADFLAATSQMRAQLLKVLGDFADVSGLSFTETTSPLFATLRFGMTKQEGNLAGTGYAPDDEQGGNLWIDRDYATASSPFRLGTFDYNLLTHELGHILGLKHPHDTDGTHGNDVAVPYDRDSHEFSVMSYRSYIGASLGARNGEGSYQQSLMMDDIAALQHLYGADFTTRSGATTYRFDPLTGEMFIDGVGQGAPAANKIFRTIWDGGGEDTYDFSNYGTNLRVSLEPGGWSTLSHAQLADLGDGHFARGNLANARLFEGDPRSLIENAKGGTGHDWITGNQVRNVLSGNGGDDHLIGLAGEDLLTGGLGRDTLRGGTEGDSLFGQGGNDTLFGEQGADWLVGGAQNDTLYGGEDGDTLNGDDGADTLRGEAGNDLLHGGSGIDTLTGGWGNDTLYGGLQGDTFVFAPGDGADTIRDFVAGGTEDTLKIQNSWIDSFAELLMVTRDVGGNAVIQIDAQTSITLEGVSKHQLTAADFSVSAFGWDLGGGVFSL